MKVVIVPDSFKRTASATQAARALADGWRSIRPDGPPVPTGRAVFNGTARPEHGAHHAIIIGLNGFTKPACDLAGRHDLIVLGREDLKRWAHGTHLYDVIRAGSAP
ncbi:hypothetical protein [Streptomyces sp. NPDC014685]|uniref:hypothetical protein n=1 Tax=Streptomyces sp. NPDC014685 TaxID=3364881 RepID=UPI0036FC63B3